MRITPVALGVVYLALAPLFATIYASFPAASFHDSNLQIELPLTSDADQLLAGMTDLIRPGVTSKWPTQAGRFRIDPGSVRASTIRADDNSHLLVELEGYYFGNTASGAGATGNFQEWIKVDLLEHVISIPPNGAETIAYPVSAVSPDGTALVPTPLTPPLPLLLKPQLGQVAYPTSGLLTLSVGVNRRLVRFFNSLQGDPSQASGNWMRMLYFSSTTLTTLGLGDITPVSSAARLWVWLEAVGGLVLIGLFLASITTGIRRQRP